MTSPILSQGGRQASVTISPVIGLGRSLLALAQATVFLFSNVQAFLVVASGFLPRYTSILHAYISVSFIGVLALPPAFSADGR